MFKNPLKYQDGGQMSEEEQLIQIFASAGKNSQVDPKALIRKAQELMNGDQQAYTAYMDNIQKCAQGDSEGIAYIKNLFKNGFKQGGKINAFICKHAKGGHIAGCGCGKSIPKAQEGHPALGQNYIQREYDGDGNAVYFLAPERKYLPINMKMDPTSDYQQQGGEYQGNGQISIVDFGNGKLRVQKDPYGPFGEVAHGKDSAAYVNRALELMKKSGMKPSSGFIQSNQEGGNLTRRHAFKLAQENKGYKRGSGQTAFAYANAKQALRNNNQYVENPEERLRGRALRQRAREMIAGQNEAPYYLTPVQKDRYNEVNYGTGTVMSQPLSQGPNIPEPSVVSTGLVGERPSDTIANLDNMSFDNAFRTALNNGKTLFVWKGKPYTTELAQKPSWTNIDVNSLPEDVRNNLTGNVEIEIPSEPVQLPDEILTFSIPDMDAGVGLPRRPAGVWVNPNHGFRSSYYKKGGKIK